MIHTSYYLTHQRTKAGHDTTNWSRKTNSDDLLSDAAITGKEEMGYWIQKDHARLDIQLMQTEHNTANCLRNTK